ncbi:MAG: DUF1761 domain-containing protein [Acidobacteriia bacterium]|jgi:hypothetical protein|nr:DUF1761 domain-containing protein [Terriglobia bacterium]
MLLLFWFVLFVVGGCLILLMPALWGKQIYNTYRGTRTATCPETHATVAVRFRALRAAFTGLSGKPTLRLAECSRWPVHADCGQECIPDAEKNAPIALVRAASPQTKRICHLPVFLAAAAAWVLGMAWHSEYLFRPLWMNATNLSDHDTRVVAEMWTPHLLTVAACLLFAYAVGALVAWFGRRTLFSGLQIALSLWLVVVAGIMLATRSNVTPQLMWIEGGYSFLGALLVGMIVGAVPRRVFVKDSE